MSARRHTRERIVGFFLPLPHYVLTSQQFASLSNAAVRLLLLIGSQYKGGNNGKLVATPKFLRPFGWRSNEATTRCLRELMDAGLLWRTRLGRRPNLAAWFALTWRALDIRDGLDESPRDFPRFIPRQIAVPFRGTSSNLIAPPGRIELASAIPTGGPMSPLLQGPAIPVAGDYLEVAISAPPAGACGEQGPRPGRRRRASPVPSDGAARPVAPRARSDVADTPPT